MVTELQKKAAQSIINVFETGHPRGDYGQVTLLPGDSGHLTYGRSQTTLASGNLYLLIKAYCEAVDAEFAAMLSEYLERLAERDITLDNDTKFHNLLSDAGTDLVMHDVQDQFFDRVYWIPSTQQADAMNIGTALGVSVVYDSHIHGSWRKLRNKTNNTHGLIDAVGEKSWIGSYVQERRAWLANHPKLILHKTVYRMDAFRQLIDEANWELALPFRVLGVLIDEDVLLRTILIRASAQDEDERTLLLRTPNMQGDDVRAVQQALVNAEFAVDVDGIFGSRTAEAVMQFQQQKNLKVDGIVGPATRSALSL
jgi:chitosanase